MELISAYADGELQETDRRRMEEHISMCESCSALLHIYREISVAVEESCVPAPEALRVGVMEKVLSDNAVSEPGSTHRNAQNNAQNNAQKRKPFRLIVLKYAPIAACLAIILLAMPWFISTFNQPKFDSFAPASTLGKNQSVQMAADSGGMETGESIPGDSSDEKILFSMNDLAPAPPPAPAPEAAAPPPAEPETTRSADGSNKDSKNSSAYIEAPAEASGAETYETDSQEEEYSLRDDWGDNEKDSIIPDSPMPVLDPDEAPESAQAPEPSVELESSGSGIPPGSMDTPGDAFDLLSGFSDAYAWIEITGELPKLLSTYNPVALDGWLNWDVYYEIPVNVAQKLIKDTGGNDGVSVTYNYDNGKYAIVLYSRE